MRDVVSSGPNHGPGKAFIGRSLVPTSRATHVTTQWGTSQENYS